MKSQFFNISTIHRSLLAGLILSSLMACSSSPTGRTQMLLYSDSDMSQLGAQSFEQMKQTEKISTNSKINAYVACVTDAITKHLEPQSSFQDWEVVVFDSTQINAFALPGGKIGVYTGLLNVATTQDQLATVIGHEISHVLAEHGNERMSRSQMTNVGLQITDLALGSSEYRATTMAALGLGVNLGITLPYGRAQETEADVLGLELMAKAGFDPTASIQLWKNMAAASGNSPAELLSTHPSHDTRIDELTAKINTLPKSNTSKPNCKA